MADKAISTVTPQETDDQFDLQLRATRSLANLSERLVSGTGVLLNGAAGATGAGQILAANSGRKKFWVQNRGTSVLTVTLGTAAVQLKACQAPGDGEGGFLCDGDWKGPVSVAGAGLSYNYGEM